MSLKYDPASEPLYIDFVYHSTLGLIVIKKKKKGDRV